MAEEAPVSIKGPVTVKGFQALLEAQRETTQQMMTAEEREADNAKREEQRAARSEAARKAREAREASGDSADAEDEKKGKITSGKTNTFLGKIGDTVIFE